MVSFNVQRWIRIALINFCVVALAGVLMRYKIAYALPGVDQKYLMHGHSHFAFVGWMTMAMMTMMVHYLQRCHLQVNYCRYNWILMAELLVAYAMLFAFIVEGYAFWSIVFSSATVLLSYVFIYVFWKDLRKIKYKQPSTVRAWFNGAMLLWLFSSAGAFMLAFLMANHISNQDLYFGAVYLFLHFQYNGWFLLACIGVFLSYIEAYNWSRLANLSKRLLVIMSITVVPTYFLSLLWLRLPSWLVGITHVFAIIQLLVLVYFIQILVLVRKNGAFRMSSRAKWLWRLSGLAFVLKLLLQLLSTWPQFSHFAFGYRPIVIGYLHLCFLGVISLFLLGYIFEFVERADNVLAKIGLLLFMAGFVVQEVVLLLQGVEAMYLSPVKYANIILFYAAVLMALGILKITIGVYLKQRPPKAL